MPFSKFIIIPIFIAFQAFMMMAIAPFIPGNYVNGAGPLGLGLSTWIAFQAWAMYFFAGFAPWNDKENGPCPWMGFKTVLGYLGGIICSICIFELNKVFGALNGSTAWGLYLAVFIVVIGVIACERVKYFNFVPAWFIGAGVFFGLMTHAAGSVTGLPEGAAHDYCLYGRLAVLELVACSVGQVFGWVTVTFRGKYEAKVAAAE